MHEYERDSKWWDSITPSLISARRNSCAPRWRLWSLIALIQRGCQTNVDRCETHQEERSRSTRKRAHARNHLSREERGIIHISTDYVFDGENANPTPKKTRRADQRLRRIEAGRRARALAANDRAWIPRVSWVFGPGRPSFIDAILKRRATK